MIGRAAEKLKTQPQALLAAMQRAGVSEQEIKARALAVQDRNAALLSRGETAVVALIDALGAAQKAGVADADLKGARDLQRQAQWRLDFVAAENSMGFHAPQEAARILGEAIDYARQGELAARTAARPAGGAPGGLK